MQMYSISTIIAATRTFIRNVRGRKFEPEINFLKYILKQDQTCFHIGASDARHSYVMAGLINGGQIYAFEPSSYSFNHLKLIIRLHRLRNIHIYKKAISDKKGMVSLVTPKKSTGHAGRSFAYIRGVNDSMVKRHDVSEDIFIKEDVESISVDGFVSSENIEKVDFIRCDMEGSEILMLRGAARTLQQHKPNLLLEIHNNALKDVFNSNADEVKDILFRLGYYMFRLSEGDIVPVNEINHEERWRDYFFIHPDRYKELPDGPFRDYLCQQIDHSAST